MPEYVSTMCTSSKRKKNPNISDQKINILMAASQNEPTFKYTQTVTKDNSEHYFLKCGVRILLF